MTDMTWWKVFLLFSEQPTAVGMGRAMHGISSSAGNTPSELYDLVLQGGRVIDPASQTDEKLDVAFLGGNVAAVEKSISGGRARQVLNVTGKIVVPGLVDLHTHIYWGGTSLGVDAESICRHSGTTTFVDAGSAGAGNFAGFKRFIVENTDLNIFAFLNVSFAGIFGFGANLWVGECADLRLLDRDECASTIEKHRDIIVGIKVRVGEEAGGQSGTRPLEIAREVSDRLGVPIMTHLDMPPPSLQEVLPLLRAGDIWTHCFRGPPNSMLSTTGALEEDIIAARKRGILFDIGHGMGSLSFKVAREMLGRGIYPDSISSDVHAFSANGPAFDVLHTASKFLCLGMSLKDVVARISANPAEIIKKDRIGKLSPGSKGDAVVLEEQVGEFEYIDSHNEKMIGERRLRADVIILNGAIWQDDQKPVVSPR
jgi:dihydroorotase